MTNTTPNSKALGKAKSNLNAKGGVHLLWLTKIQPSPENDEIYRPIDPKEPSLINLVASIKKHGVMEPLVVNNEGFILSGHRRYAAAKLAGKRKVPVRRVNVKRDTDKFMTQLREYNRQRSKGIEETIHEEVISTDPTNPRYRLIDHHRRESEIVAAPMDLGPRKYRKAISSAKGEMVAAIMRTLEERALYRPLSARSIHYPLLNYPPLIHMAKPKSRYRNDDKSYKALIDVLIRMRTSGMIPMDWIDDETRPITTWATFDTPADFIQKQIAGFLKGYNGNFLKSQPHHYELLGEKNTVNVVLQRVAAKYRMPMTSGRGYASLPPRAKMADRFKASGKDKLVVFTVSDFDPDGEEIGQSFGRSMRDDFDIENVDVFKLALTYEQTQRFDLPPALPVKKKSSVYPKFFEKYGCDDVWELEAVPPELLEQTVTEGIEQVINSGLLNKEIDAENAAWDHLEEVRKKVRTTLMSSDLLSGEEY
ncbi:MAG: ParB N-terminal domain-containing protein [Pirellulales bacterium]